MKNVILQLDEKDFNTIFVAVAEAHDRCVEQIAMLDRGTPEYAILRLEGKTHKEIQAVKKELRESHDLYCQMVFHLKAEAELAGLEIASED